MIRLLRLKGFEVSLMAVRVGIHLCHNFIEVDSDTQSSLIVQPIFARNLHKNKSNFPKTTGSHNRKYKK